MNIILKLWNCSKIRIDTLNHDANLLCNDEGIEHDCSEAIKYYKMVIDKGNYFASINYQLMQNGPKFKQ